MSVIRKAKHDPDNYAQMSIPYDNADVANDAIIKFFDEIGEIRKKHKVTDVLIVAKGSMKHEDGVGEFMVHSSYGSYTNQLGMAAYVYGKAQQEHNEIISKLIAGKTK